LVYEIRDLPKKEKKRKENLSFFCVCSTPLVTSVRRKNNPAALLGVLLLPSARPCTSLHLIGKREEFFFASSSTRRISKEKKMKFLSFIS
jgi:hypothetical protein